MGAISGHRGNEMEKKITRLFFAPPFIATALASLALVPLFLVDLGKAQEKKRPCPKPYIRVVSPKASTPGNKIVIRGRRFKTEPGKVSFSPNVKAEVVKWMNTRILVIVPQAATSGSITVSIPCGRVSNEVYFKVIK
jgi:hypothetical protein